jgi:hypothetical protein
LTTNGGRPDRHPRRNKAFPRPIVLSWRGDGTLENIRDFRYARYVMANQRR